MSSDFFLTSLAHWLQKVLRPGPHFDIRWLGLVNGAFLLLGIGIWIYALPGYWRVWLGLLLVLIWTDVAYVQYLNTFYMDTAAMIFLVLCVAAGLHVAQDPSNRAFSLLMLAAAVLFAVSKFQHAVPALTFIPLFVVFALWNRDRLLRWMWLGGCVLLLAGSYIVMGRITAHDRSLPVYNTVFLRIAPQAPDPLRALEALGLGPNELPLLNTYVYLQSSPARDAKWLHEFSLRCNYRTLLIYYLKHPLVSLHLLYQGLSGPAANIRTGSMNVSFDDGFGPGAQASHFRYWTDLRSFLFRHVPWHIFLLVIASVVGGLWLLRSPTDRVFAALVLSIQALGALEYGIAMLADAAETDRHLMIFHVATEISILLLPVLIHKVYSQRRNAKERARMAGAVGA